MPAVRRLVLSTAATCVGLLVVAPAAFAVGGEHGGEPSSVAFCDQLGLDYVSCSPYRVPIARLAAAQSAAGGIAES